MKIFGFPAIAVFLTFLLVSEVKTASYTAARDLENYCGSTLRISCPGSNGEAGRLRFYRMPRTVCQVTVTLESLCGVSSEYFMIYLNIRNSYMPTNSLMEIYDTSGSRTLGKSWSGGESQPQYSNPTSAGQYLSRSARQPKISIEFTPSSSYPPDGIHEVFFDYVILSDTRSPYNTLCSALSGYVSNSLICDITDDRVNCPDSYTPSVYDMNAAWYRQSCTFESGATITPRTWPPTTTSFYYGPAHVSFSTLSGGAIAGIVIGCVAFVAIIIAIIVVCGHRDQQAMKQKAAFTQNAHSAAPAVVFTQQDGPAPQPYPTQVYAPGPYPPGTMPQPTTVTTTSTTSQ
ncbi:uncharacterized protein LOC129595558 [Paramacrobiotus metropolitanus]|uniref:uncharacterized protein LOC129595558 n=1 Tax=Paramacrobiotus metropolitanus TaxID=2943436 RepID=UPI002445BC5A|nr:uncharacterized protein LOC129595558 [Paramacrobiotus metropolitanus]